MRSVKPPASTDRTSQRGDLRRALGDLHDFPALLLPDLPLPVTLWIELPGAPAVVCLTGAHPGSDVAGPTALGPEVVFDRDETAAILEAIARERVFRRELLGFCFDKWRRPSLRVSLPDALGGATTVGEPPPALSVGQALARLGARVLRVEVFAGAPAQPLPVAA